jgi:hypothetical protein
MKNFSAYLIEFLFLGVPILAAIYLWYQSNQTKKYYLNNPDITRIINKRIIEEGQ